MQNMWRQIDRLTRTIYSVQFDINIDPLLSVKTLRVTQSFWMVERKSGSTVSEVRLAEMIIISIFI